MTLDDRLEPQIMNNDTCMECGVNFKTAKEAILSDLLEIIGEDEVPTIPINDYHWRIRNEYRQELREKVRKYCE